MVISSAPALVGDLANKESYSAQPWVSSQP